MIIIKKIYLFLKRESKLFYSNIVDLFSNILFFFLSIFVFIFALGTDEQLLKTIGIGIIWSLLLLSSTLSLRKFYEDDFKNEILSIGTSPKIFFIFTSSKYENQSLKPGIGESVPKCLIFGNSS